MTWKEQQRALTERARKVHAHRERRPGARLKFPSGALYRVFPDGSLRRIQVVPVHEEPKAQL